MAVETSFLSKKLRVDYMVDGEEKLNSLTLANLNKDVSGEQLGQIVEGLKPLINGQIAKIYVTEVTHGITD
ncbi:hypothetical protein ACQQ96_08330 [Lactobacillus johnsonii]|uniref:DUF1659 domain-containing protein n=1 Tax=Lactobacillus johnsonii TaxID=33959 RepID=UPI000214F446|nr:hypothetical protein [Lactobacillus johnsonii]MDY2640742.1 hypothetical protein [Ligilactobacillus salivarius]RST61788.1 hypothetical protein EIZ77_08370 [Bifidobacterium animalis subsp. lactis]MBW8461094.1 hypothetical protein [Lactobacillus johnsonii]MBZ4027596.1 hypothetical protein [Lactobacillus johnsonii]MCI6763238.1 hypothetical protein [Lactobacillus johnsonii]